MSLGHDPKNTADLGGGIYNADMFSMSGGVITNNKAVGRLDLGGGVYNRGIFTMFGGEISANTANWEGGGVYSSGTFTMSEGRISCNIALTDGGGVYNRYDSGGFTMFGGVISGNTATMNGGGVYNDGDSYMKAANFTMFGGVISDNTARYSGGGGVSNSFGRFSLFGGIISDNTASSGGGVSNSGGNFSLSGGEISRNTATVGGGLYLYSFYYSESHFTMFNGLINSNIAIDGGGIYLKDGFVALFDGTISGNTASNNGGAIWVAVENFDKCYVYDEMVFSDNHAYVAYNRASIHDELYHTYIGSNVVWTIPFTQGYNNYDISYTSGTPYMPYNVTIIDSYAELSGAGNYTPGVDVTIDAGTRLGYTFLGWIVNEGGIIISDNTRAVFIMPANDVIITANWGTLIEYNIVYALDGGTNPSINPEVYTAFDLPLSIADPSKPGFTFLGWIVTYADGTILTVDDSFNISLGTIGELLLSANWKEHLLTYYSITYELNGGIYSEDNPLYYSVADLPVVIVDPVKESYDFLGWTVVFLDGNQPDITIPTVCYIISEGTTGSIELTAVWEPTIEESLIVAYNRVYAEFNSYYDAETGQFFRGLFGGFTAESVLEAEQILNAAGQVHRYLLVAYGKLDVGCFGTGDNAAAVEVATHLLTQAIADMNTALKPVAAPVLFAEEYDMGSRFRVWLSYPIGIEHIVATVDGQATNFGIILSGAKTWVHGMGYLEVYSYLDVVKTTNWQSIVLRLTVDNQVLVLEFENDWYEPPVELENPPTDL
jgi:uncharacterized repeat protein (TIGR02543 family)